MSDLVTGNDALPPTVGEVALVFCVCFVCFVSVFQLADKVGVRGATGETVAPNRDKTPRASSGRDGTMPCPFQTHRSPKTAATPILRTTSPGYLCDTENMVDESFEAEERVCRRRRCDRIDEGATVGLETAAKQLQELREELALPTIPRVNSVQAMAGRKRNMSSASWHRSCSNLDDDESFTTEGRVCRRYHSDPVDARAFEPLARELQALRQLQALKEELAAQTKKLSLNSLPAGRRQRKESSGGKTSSGSRFLARNISAASWSTASWSYSSRDGRDS